MKRSINGAEHNGIKSRKRDNESHDEGRMLKFYDHNVHFVLDGSGMFWFRWIDVSQALDIRDVPSNIHDFCERKKFIKLYSDLDNRNDCSLTISGDPLFIMAEGIRYIVSRTGRPRGGQFMESILELIHKLTSAVSETPPAPVIDAVRNPDAEELEKLRRENAKQKDELARRDKEKKLTEKQLEKWKSVARNLKSREPVQIVYIATSERYALQNKFKIGGVKNLDSLKGRLAGYNSGRDQEDNFYYCYWVKCSNHRKLELRIADAVGEHRLVKDKEMYHMHYDSVIEVVNYFADRFNEEVDKYEQNFERIFAEIDKKEPVVPKPWVVNGAEFRQMKQADAETYVGIEEQYNFDSMEEEEKNSFVATHLDKYIKNNNAKFENSGVSIRKNFENYLSGCGVKFKIPALWKVLRPLAEDKKVPMKYRN